MDAEKFNNTIKLVTDLLAQQKYEELIELSRGVRLSADELKRGVKEYGRQIISLPAQAYKQIDVWEIKNANPKAWNVDVPIFTSEEGLSDLTLSLSLKESKTSYYEIEILDLHVL